MSALERLSRRLLAIERELLLRKSPQLADSSIEDGALRVNDLDGNTTMQIGKQFDGTSVAATLTGPTPPVPSAPTARPMTNGVVAIWDGTFADGSVAPMDFARVEVHVGPTPGFYDESATYLRASISSPRGGEVPVPFAVGDTDPKYIVLVARTQSGARSVASGETSEVPDTIGPVTIEPGSITAEDIADFTIPVVKFQSNMHYLY